MLCSLTFAIFELCGLDTFCPARVVKKVCAVSLGWIGTLLGMGFLMLKTTLVLLRLGKAEFERTTVELWKRHLTETKKATKEIPHVEHS